VSVVVILTQKDELKISFFSHRILKRIKFDSGNSSVVR
jgi:hypothetical protein